MNNKLIKLVLIITFGLSNANAGFEEDIGGCPPTNNVTSRSDQYGFYSCQCTSYVAWKINQNGVELHNNYIEVNGVNNYIGNYYSSINNETISRLSHAGNWDNAVETIGISVDNHPQTGDIAVWDPQSGGTGWAGHVAYVESVNPNGSVNVSEYNFGIPLGYAERNNITADHYIHVGGNTNSVEIYDFWVRDPNIPIYTNGNFDAQFKLRNNGVENIHYDAVALAIHNPDGTHNMNMMLENDINLPFESGFVSVTSMPNMAGSYTVIVKVNENGSWRHLSTKDITIVSEETSSPAGGDTWTTGAYSDNANISQTLSISEASSLTVTITGRTESNYDFITIYDANGTEVGRFHGDINESFTVNGSSIQAVLTSDGSVTESGVTVSIN